MRRVKSKCLNCLILKYHQDIFCILDKDFFVLIFLNFNVTITGRNKTIDRKYTRLKKQKGHSHKKSHRKPGAYFNRGK